MMMLEWNNSSLACLQQCGEKFRRRYLERERVPPSPRALRGTVVHRVASHSYAIKAATNLLPSVEEVKDRAADEYRQAWQGGVLLSDEDRAVGVHRIQADGKDFAVDLSGYHVQTVAPAIRPVGIERRIVVKPRNSDLAIHGTIDLIDAQPDGEVIRDLKTTQASPPKTAAEDSQQLTMYAMIRMCEVGTLPKSLALDYLVRTPTGAKRHVPLSTTRGPDDIEALVARINAAVRSVERGAFLPTNPESWWCSKQWCEYWTTCVYVRRGDRPTA